MSNLTCAHCRAIIQVSNINLVPRTHPKLYYRCNHCSGDNILLRRTLLLSVIPCIAIMFLVLVYNPLEQDSHWVFLVASAGYITGIPLGIWLARRYGGFAPTQRPQLIPRQRK